MLGNIMPIVILVLLALSAYIILSKMVTTLMVYEYERGVKFRKGKFSEVVGPGKYTYLNSVTRIDVFDLRPSIIQVNGQEVLTGDHVSVKISLTAQYQIIDPKELISRYENYSEHLYTTIQLKLREVISSMELDQVLANRQEINERVKDLVVDETTLAGLVVHSVELKDIMLPSDLKKAFAEALKAKKEAQASLEKARGEMATIRSLANAAKMMEKNPELLQLRLIQTMDSSQGNTFIIDTNQQTKWGKES
ncbi:slipin family protein [Bacillus sp. B-jedd]|uniref:slipin family protein n=1 Tax=Bacillus sp. B-jedd TaxID=1476857 RepID=UPI0005155551|nr:slipin family protein [Bacillus sp. B-jedd]CEG27108.1 SPFH domain/Band 7 family protein [Bacillus sp. B-jedd]